jgi:hypothetical protein
MKSNGKVPSAWSGAMSKQIEPGEPAAAVQVRRGELGIQSSEVGGARTVRNGLH